MLVKNTRPAIHDTCQNAVVIPTNEIKLLIITTFLTNFGCGVYGVLLCIVFTTIVPAISGMAREKANTEIYAVKSSVTEAMKACIMIRLTAMRPPQYRLYIRIACSVVLVYSFMVMPHKVIIAGPVNHH